MTDIAFSGNKQEYVGEILQACPPRFAMVTDVKAILKFEASEFTESDTGPWRLARYIEAVPEGTEILEINSELVGCIRGSMQSSKIAPDRPYGQIDSLAVAPEYRGRGLGELLLGRMVASMLAENPTGICLYTRASNVAMQGLAGKFGFKTEDTVEDYYSRPKENAFFMVHRREPIPA